MVIESCMKLNPVMRTWGPLVPACSSLMEQAVRRAVIKPNTSAAKDIFVYIRVSFWGQNEREYPARYPPTTDYTVLFLLYEVPYASSTVSTCSPIEKDPIAASLMRL